MSRLARALRGWVRPLSQWSPIGLPELIEPGELVRVTVRAGQRERDVTRDQAIVSLAPLQVAIGGIDAPEASLEFSDRATGKRLGWLDLMAVPSPQQGPGPTVYAVRGGGHRCVDWPTRAWQRVHRALHARGSGFRMSDAAQDHLAIFYLLPRPVALVSVDDGASSNLFPMDLIGPVDDSFSLALRRTSPSVATLRRSGHVALGDVAARDHALAYRLGEHHRETSIDWSGLPRLVGSAQLGLRLPASSLRIREFRIDRCADIGSHCWFLCRLIGESHLAAGAPLCHTSGIHSHYRASINRVPWTPAGDAA
jgi:flavin reductase (DIM6/NTAB) family NADH-FMN oxidoreductase RutF